ncbi:MAG: hypothetical protein JSR46_06485, partial [Verrucomicrobia bacterium]|nr:hypothetical protein [Verrucomicrobiota bacterium]
KPGEIANRILLVGDPERAKLVRGCLDNPDCFEYASNRGFTTYTGTKDGVPVSIMSIGMGMPMMDFAVREIRAITKGPLAIVRLGSCGTPNEKVAIGTVVVANRSFAIQTNYDSYHTENGGEHFRKSKPLDADSSLHALLVDTLKKGSSGNFPVVEGLDATADSFYGSQGRIDPEFLDHNETLIDEVMQECPDTSTLQMETFHLYHLARLNCCARVDASAIRASACAIVLAQRKSDQFLPNSRKHEIEVLAGSACLKALSEQKL